MGTKFFRSLIMGLSVMLSFSTITLATDYVHRVIIVNEGYYDNSAGQQLVPVSVATYDPASRSYTVFDEIEDARFATEAIFEGDYIYVAADKFLMKYDRYTLQLVAQQNVTGIRSIEAWNDKLLVTRGEYQVSLPSYFQVYNQSDLSLDYELDTNNGPQYSSQNIEVIGDKAYFIINNGFDFPNYKGLIGVVDLHAETYGNEIDLGPDGLNPDNLMRDGDKLYTLNNKDYTGSSVSIFNLDDASLATTNLPNVTTGCGTSTFFTNVVCYQQFGSMKVHQFDPQNATVADSVDFGKNFYGLGVDPVNNYLYATTTDFVSSGKAYIYDVTYALIDSFIVGVSAGHIAFDVRKVSGIGSIENQFSFSIYPNPVTDEFRISNSEFKIQKVEVFDVNGKLVINEEHSNQKQINVKSLPAGMYNTVVTTQDGLKSSARFVKQ